MEMPSWFIGGVQNVGKMQQMLEKLSPLIKELLLIIIVHLYNHQA